MTIPEQPVAIRSGEASGVAPLATLYRAAFPTEDLLPLLAALLALRSSVLALEVVAGDELVGHVVFTRCAVEGAAGAVALLGPLAVAPARQRRGIGATLVREDLRRLAG